jgi:hypothetical protein
MQIETNWKMTIVDKLLQALFIAMILFMYKNKLQNV